MASLWLPAPTRSTPGPLSELSSNSNSNTSHSTSLTLHTNDPNSNSNSNSNPINAPKSSKPLRAPSYLERCQTALQWRSMSVEERKTSKLKPPFVPRSIHDFDDGGAFPEIHVAQYPLHMGNPHLKKKKHASQLQGGGNSSGSSGGSGGRNTVSGLISSSALVNVDIDANGEISYDAIVKNGTNSDKQVYTKHSDLKGGEADPSAIQLPTEEEEAESTAKTSAALTALLSKKNALSTPTGSALVNAQTSKNQESKTQFISYKPNPNAPGYNPAAKQRVIQMVPAQLDPMMPPKHQHKKAPRGPADDPVPILHAPPTKLSKEERAKWNIPACISNWKNTRGYTIPLDKRLAADGRGLRETTTVNPNFATLSESLYVAERQAREEVKMRAKVQKQLVMAEKEARERDLRDLANQARLERHSQSQPTTTTKDSPSRTFDSNENGVGIHTIPRDQDATNSSNNSHHDDKRHQNYNDNEENYEDVSAAAQRDRLRIARKKERERELRLEKAGKKQRLEDERDVSEKIALGVHTGNGGSASQQVDSRLYNQSAGLDAGFGAEDEYNTYSKPLFERDAIAKNIYKPTQSADGKGVMMDGEEEYEALKAVGTSKFQPDRGFAGAGGGGSAGPRSAPVQFEKGHD